MRRELDGRGEAAEMLVRGSLLLEAAAALPIPLRLKLAAPPKLEKDEVVGGGLLRMLQFTAPLWPPELPSRLVGRNGLPPTRFGELIPRACAASEGGLISLLGSKKEPARIRDGGLSVTGVGGSEDPVATIVELDDRRTPRAPRFASLVDRAWWAARDATSSEDLSRSDASSRTKMAGSELAVSRITSASPTFSIKSPYSSAASTTLLMILSKLSRTRAFFVRSFCEAREKSSGCAREDAIGGERRRSFCNGSRKFSNESAFEFEKASMMP